MHRRGGSRRRIHEVAGDCLFLRSRDLAAQGYELQLGENTDHNRLENHERIAGHGRCHKSAQQQDDAADAHIMLSAMIALTPSCGIFRRVLTNATKAT